MQQMKRSIPNVQWIIDDSKALSLRFFKILIYVNIK